MTEIINLILHRLDDTEVIEDRRLEILIRTVSDRLCIRLGVSVLPAPFYTICADAVLKMWRRLYYEGVASENDGGISVSFVEDVLSEYAEEIAQFKAKEKAVRFL